MALINCKECGKEISDKAGACPHCGAPIQLDKIYNEKETDLVTVKPGFVAYFVFYFFTFVIVAVGLRIFWGYSFEHNDQTSLITGFVIIFIGLMLCLIFTYNTNNTYITLTNKRITGKLTRLYRHEEINYPLRQIKSISTFGAFGVYHFVISTSHEWFQIGFAKNSKEFKKKYFSLIEDKYKY